jgi:hypothetical protein
MKSRRIIPAAFYFSSASAERRASAHTHAHAAHRAHAARAETAHATTHAAHRHAIAHHSATRDRRLADRRPKPSSATARRVGDSAMAHSAGRHARGAVLGERTAAFERSGNSTRPAFLARVQLFAGPCLALHCVLAGATLVPKQLLLRLVNFAEVLVKDAFRIGGRCFGLLLRPVSRCACAPPDR